MQNRVQIALARRERLRKARDRAWTVLAGLAVAAAFGVIMLVSRISDDTPAIPWIEIALYALIAIVAGSLPVRAFTVARRLSRRLDETNAMDTPLTDERPVSIWDEVFRMRGGRKS